MTVKLVSAVRGPYPKPKGEKVARVTTTMQDAMGNVSTPMPQYKSHKNVWALKIKEITVANPPTIAELEEILAGQEFHGDEEIVGAMITPEENGFAAFPVSRRYMLKHNPQVGGYYVVYADGYKSWSPAQAFEGGYAPILGETGRFPDGKLNPSDEGELQFAVGHENGSVVLSFGKPVAWMAMPPKTAEHFAALLTDHAQRVGG